MSLDPNSLNALVARVVQEVKGASIDVKSIRGFFGALRIAPRVVEKVQRIGAEFNLLGSDKREVAVAAILLLVPDRWVPDSLIAPFVGWAVDKAYAAMKARFGK